MNDAAIVEALLRIEQNAQAYRMGLEQLERDAHALRVQIAAPVSKKKMLDAKTQAETSVRLRQSIARKKARKN